MKYKVNKGFIIQKVGNKAVIFDNEKSVLFTFNKTATEIFRKMKKGLNDDEIINQMAKKYSISKEKAKNDLEAIIAELKKNKIIYSSKPKK